GDGRGEGGGPGLRHALHDGAVVGGALGEQGGDVVPGGGVGGAPVPAGQRLVRRVGVGIAVRVVGGADPGQDLVSGGAAHDLVLDHQARNDSGGGAGASLVSVQPASGGGSRLIRPDLATSRPARPAARCAAASSRGERST